MIDLQPYIGRGFPGDIDRGIAEVGVAGIDREQAHSLVRLCEETEPILYGSDFSPTRLRYRPGSRPTLERIAAGLRGHTPMDTARAVMAWTAGNVVHPHVVGHVAPDRAMTEEELIESGLGWCNEQARVFIALCEVMEVPARLCFLFHANLRSGHTTAEAYLDGRWAWFDVTFDITITLPDGRPAEGRDLSGEYRSLAHHAYREKLKAHYERIKPFVETMPGWCAADRPDPERGGDLLAYIGICNYVIDGVDVPYGPLGKKRTLSGTLSRRERGG